jgi:hypothetical protein
MGDVDAIVGCGYANTFGGFLGSCGTSLGSLWTSDFGSCVRHFVADRLRIDRAVLWFYRDLSGLHVLAA